MLAFFGLPGWIELIIIGVMLLVAVAVVVALVVAQVVAQNRSRK